MKIILSPSKKQNFDIQECNKETSFFYENLTNVLLSTLKSLSKEKLNTTLKIKGKLLDETYLLYQSLESNSLGMKAINCYQGVVFEQIKAEQYNEKQCEYLNKHLVILSAMYGVLEPSTLMWPYRMDMTVNLKNIQLYKYWQNAMDKYFLYEDCIINLASNEFSKMIEGNRNRMITIYFQEEQENKSLKTISYNAKKARGKMAHLCILNMVKTPEEIQKYQVDGYDFDKMISDNQNYFFIKKFHER